MGRPVFFQVGLSSLPKQVLLSLKVIPVDTGVCVDQKSTAANDIFMKWYMHVGGSKFLSLKTGFGLLMIVEPIGRHNHVAEGALLFSFTYSLLLLLHYYNNQVRYVVNVRW